VSHPKELIAMIMAKLQAEYPVSAGFEYVIEKALLGTRMLPDILIKHGQKNVCAVEIGYTRPEKLTDYRRDHRIHDVRWYDREGKLHVRAAVAPSTFAEKLQEALPAPVLPDMHAPSTLTIKVIHGRGCPNSKDASNHKCKCRKQLYIYENGKDRTESAKTRSWEQAEARAHEKMGELDPVRIQARLLESEITRLHQALVFCVTSG
jgi:hypothetical protein